MDSDKLTSGVFWLFLFVMALIAATVSYGIGQIWNWMSWWTLPLRNGSGGGTPQNSSGSSIGQAAIAAGEDILLSVI